MKDIKQYLHLYFHNEIEITEVFINVGYKVGQRFIPSGGEMQLALHENPVFACKPILRPLSDMTEEEFYECKTMVAKLQNQPGFVNKVLIGEQFKNITTQKIYKEDFHITAWLLSRGFDLFGLIESGLAIDSKSLPLCQHKN